jgi:hypothetical protein
VVDVQGIPRIVQKQYCTHPGMMQLKHFRTGLRTTPPGDPEEISCLQMERAGKAGRHRTATRPISDSEDAQTFLDYIEDAVIYGQARGYYTL